MSDPALPPFPVNSNFSTLALWVAGAVAAAFIHKLPVRLLNLILGKIKDFGRSEKKNVSRGDFLVSIAEIKEEIHRGQQNTENTLKMVNDNVNATRAEVGSLGHRVDNVMLVLAQSGRDENGAGQSL